MHELLELSLRHMQGRLFELSVKKGFASVGFINTFMRSKCAAALDMDFNKLQWLGEAYIMAELIDEAGDKLVPGEQYPKDALFWAGYIYRYWHSHTGESSKDILKQAPAERVLLGYPYYHTVAEEIAIKDMKEETARRLARKKRTDAVKGEFMADLIPAMKLR